MKRPKNGHEELNDYIDYLEDKLKKLKKPKTKCPFCANEMKGFELIHYKCKKCNETFTN